MTGTQKYGRIFWSILLLTLIFLCPFTSNAQPDLPDKPDLIRVTVDHSDNGVWIQWEASTDPNVEFYHLYKMENRIGTHIASFQPSVLEFKHMTAGLENLAYTVTAEDSTGNESLLGENEHRAVTASVEFNPCAPANNITWSAYEGWENQISGYIIFGGTDMGSLDTIDFVSAATLSYSHTPVDVGNTYYYFVETLHTSKIISQSAIESVSTLYPEAPAFLEVDYVSVIDRSTVEIQFSADINGPVKDFRLMRRNNAQAPYSEVATIANPVQSIQVVQDQYQTSALSYEYAVQSVFQPQECNTQLVISQSLPRPSILLQGSYQNQMTTLTWTPYREDLADISGYIIQRKKDENDFITIESSVSPDATLWREPIDDVVNGHQIGEIQYRIQAVGITDGWGNPGLSVSNVVDIHIETDMQMPNAFTPESNDINSTFKPVLDFAPKKFTMVIYDRMGRKLFETVDPGEGWDGKFRGGNFVDEGVYVYYIQYTDYTGLFKSFTGNLTVLYP